MISAAQFLASLIDKHKNECDDCNINIETDDSEEEIIEASCLGCGLIIYPFENGDEDEDREDEDDSD